MPDTLYLDTSIPSAFYDTSKPSMATYKNEYSHEEDPMLWELHEIRNEIRIGLSDNNYSDINNKAKSILQSWKERVHAGDGQGNQ